MFRGGDYVDRNDFKEMNTKPVYNSMNISDI